MGNVMKRITSIVLVVMLAVTGFFPQSVEASEPGAIYYCVTGEEGQYCECLDDAFRACKDKGGRIVIYKDREINFPDDIPYRCLNKNTTLMVYEGAVLTIGENGFQMDGLLQIIGKVDLEHSEGILYGEGAIQTLGKGCLVKRPYEMNKKEQEICLEAKAISYGQSLSEAEIPEDEVNWRAAVEGKWSFRQPDYVPQAGTREYDLVFTPQYSMTYETRVFEQCGRVTTQQAVPERNQYQPVELHVGENLLDVMPEISYISPVTGQVIPGSFSFDQSQQTLTSVGEQEISGTFTPQDSNYATVNQYVKVKVCRTTPEICAEPVVRNQGFYGQTLAQIRFLSGSCINPYNGKSICGSWEWRDAAERLQLGTREYSMLFIPDEEGYERKEISLRVTTLPKEMEDIEWPVCSGLVYGETLGESKLSFDKNDYGVFYWQNENLCPKVKNSGAVVVFRPADTEIYDWSKLAGYEEKSGTVSFKIPVCVQAIEGELPAIEATQVKEGSCVSGASLQVHGTEGKAFWQNPEQVVEKSGWYDLYFIPSDVDNYDWSSYHPDEQGRISMKTYVTAIKESVTDVLPAVPERTEGADKLNTTGNRSTVDDGSTGQTQTITNAAEDVSPFVITQMVSKMSTIQNKITVTVKKTSWQKVKRKGTTLRLSWKKVKGVKYQIQYGRNSRWRNSKKKIVKSNSYILKGLKKEKSYYIRIRCVKAVYGRKYYSRWDGKRRV